MCIRDRIYKGEILSQSLRTTPRTMDLNKRDDRRRDRRDGDRRGRGGYNRDRRDGNRQGGRPGYQGGGRPQGGNRPQGGYNRGPRPAAPAAPKEGGNKMCIRDRQKASGRNPQKASARK